MATRKLSAEFLGKLILDASQPEKALPGINDLIKKLKAELDLATKAAGEMSTKLGGASKDSKEFQELKQQIRSVKVALSELNTVKKALKIVDPNDTESLKRFHREIADVVRTMDGLDRRQAVKKGVFGLNPATIKEGEASLRKLQQAAKEARAELAQIGDEKGLKKLEAAIKKNESLLRSQVEGLRQRSLVEEQTRKAQETINKAHTQGIIMDRARDAAKAKAKAEEERKASPEFKEEQIREAAQRRLGLIGGVGGASLMAVQASLMANYSILNNITGAITNAVRTSVELEASFRNIQAVTVTTSKEMTGLEGTIKSVAAASKFSSVEVAQAALILGQAGLNAKQTGEALKAVSTLAVASGTSITESVDLVTSVIGVFDKKASEALDVTNKITAAANSSKVNVEKLTLAFQYAGNTASQMGISFEETTAAMAAMSNAGIKSGSTMGTGLRAFLTETQKPSEEFLKIITSLGLSLTDLDFKSHGLIGVARKLREAGFIASDAIKSFDVRSAAAFNAMVANPEDLERQYKLLLDTNAGLAAEAIQMDSLKAQSARLTTSLGNLASAGFAPLSKVMQGVAGTIADIVQAMSEWNVVMGIVGTTLGVVLTSAIAKYTVSLALGVASTLGLTKATAASVASMTAGAAITRVVTAAQAAFATATAGATVSTLSLAGALRVLSSMSIFGAVGLAVTAATAAFAAFNYAMDSSKRKNEELRAALDNSKGAYEENMGVIDSLNNRIQELNHKSDTLAGSQKDVELMGAALTAQFGKEGFASDKLSDSFAKQAEQLKKLRDLKEQAAKQSLDLARLDAAAMVKSQEGELGEELRLVRQRGVAPQALDRALDNENIKMLNAAQVNILQDMREALKKGDPNNPGPVASASEILKILSLKLKDADMFGSRSRFFAEGAEQLQGINLKATNLRQGREEQRDLEFKEAQTTATKALREGPLLDKKSFTEAMAEVKGVGIEQNLVASGAARGANGKTDPLLLHKLTMEETRKSLDRLALIEQKLEERRINTTDEAELSGLQVMRTEVKANREAIKVAMDRLTEQTQPAAERVEQMRKAAAQGSDRQKNRDVSAEAIRANMLAESQFKHRGVIDPVAQQRLIDADMQGANQRAVNTRDNVPGIATAVRQHRLAEEVALREAKIYQQDANLAGSPEAAKMYLDMAMDARKRAKDAALAQLETRLKEDSAVGGNRSGLTEAERSLERKNFQTDQEEKDRQFVQNFSGFTRTADSQLKAVRAQTNETRQDLLDLQNLNTQKNFARGERARELQERVDVNTQLGDPRGENLMLVRDLKRELVQVDKEYLVSKEAERRMEDLIIEGEERQLALMEASLKTTEARVRELQKLHDLGPGFLGPDQQEEFIQAKGELEPQRGEVRNQRALVAAARRQRVDTQSQLYTVRSRIRENMIPEIKEQNLENLGQAMDDVWAKWQNISANMDVIRTMREGFGDQINGFTGNLSNMFMEITTGTKKVSASFKDMALNTIGSIAQIINQLFAMWAVQQLVGLAQTAIGALGSFGGGMVSGSSIGTMPGSIFSGSTFNPSSISIPMPLGADGGLMTPEGRFQQYRYMAGGGPVTGGVAGRDSVPTMLMPGEFVIKKSAVDTVGTAFLHNLNSQAQSIARGAQPNGEKETKSKILNVWIVTPDQAKQEGMSPNDVVAVISDNMVRGGPIKQLVKKINLGTL